MTTLENASMAGRSFCSSAPNRLLVNCGTKAGVYLIYIVGTYWIPFQAFSGVVRGRSGYHSGFDVKHAIGVLI